MLRRNGGNVLKTLSRSLCAVGVRSVFFGWGRFPPGRTWSGERDSLPLPRSPRALAHQGLPCRAFQGGYLELGSGEDHLISGVAPGEMALDVEA